MNLKKKFSINHTNKNQFISALSGLSILKNFSSLLFSGCIVYPVHIILIVLIELIRSHLIANIVMIGFGCAIGWFSPALPWLRSADTPLLSGPLSTAQTSWSGSVICLGGMMGNILFSALTFRIGAKMTLLSLAFPQMVL